MSRLHKAGPNHNKVIAVLATAGSLFAVSSAHAIVPVAAAAIGALAGGAVGAAATKPPAVAVVPQPPAVAVAPDTSTTVIMGAPAATVEEVVPAPRPGYRWERGHYEIRAGVSAWVPGHWIAIE